MSQNAPAKALDDPGPTARPAPVATEDGRPYAPDPDEPDAELAFWQPSPARDGDAVYCCGVRVGTFHGEDGKAGGWWIDTVPTRDMPPNLAAQFLAMSDAATPSR